MSWLFGRGGSTAAIPTAPAAGAAAAWSINYAPMRAFLDGGLHDVGHASSLRAAAGGEGGDGGDEGGDGGVGGVGSVGESGGERYTQQNHSVPTLINEDVMHATAMRLDYALVNAALAERCTLTSSITRDSETERLSDHYPLLTDLSCSQ